jgi:hypothetical protein
MAAIPVSRDTPLFEAAILEVQRVRNRCREARLELMRHRAEHLEGHEVAVTRWRAG